MGLLVQGHLSEAGGRQTTLLLYLSYACGDGVPGETALDVKRDLSMTMICFLSTRLLESRQQRWGSLRSIGEEKQRSLSSVISPGFQEPLALGGAAPCGHVACTCCRSRAALRPCSTTLLVCFSGTVSCYDLFSPLFWLCLFCWKPKACSEHGEFHC